MKHLLKMGDLNKDQINEILDLADRLKAENKQGVKHRFLRGKTLGMIFQSHPRVQGSPSRSVCIAPAVIRCSFPRMIFRSAGVSP